jgi:hypothetical protein
VLICSHSFITITIQFILNSAVGNCVKCCKEWSKVNPFLLTKDASVYEICVTTPNQTPLKEWHVCYLIKIMSFDLVKYVRHIPCLDQTVFPCEITFYQMNNSVYRAEIVTAAFLRNPVGSSKSNDTPTGNYYWCCLSAMTVTYSLLRSCELNSGSYLKGAPSHCNCPLFPCANGGHKCKVTYKMQVQGKTEHGTQSHLRPGQLQC